MPFGGALTVGLIGAGSSILGGLFGKSAAQKAAEQQAAAAAQANQFVQGNTTNIQEIVNKHAAEAQNMIQGNFAPYQGLGNTAVGGLNTALQNPFQFNLADDPGYQFRLAQGQKAIEQSAAARGGAVSGGALKALTQYGQGFASNEYQNAFARHQQGIQNLFQGAGLGLNAAGQSSGLQTGVLGQQASLDANALENENALISSNLTGAGNARAAGTVGGANAIGGALNGVANSANQLFLYNLLNSNAGGGEFGAGTGTNASNSTLDQQYARGF